MIRALNVLTVKIVERSEHTRVTCALVRLLREAVPNSSLPTKYTELVMKCLWKVIKALPGWMREIDMVRVHFIDCFYFSPLNFFLSLM